MSGKQQRGKSFLIGVLVGGVAGAIGALLTAPKAGRELRKDIAEQAGIIGGKTQQIAETVGQRTQQVAKSISAHTSEWAAKTKSATTGIVSEVKSWRLIKETPSAESGTAAASGAETAAVPATEPALEETAAK